MECRMGTDGVNRGGKAQRDGMPDMPTSGPRTTGPSTSTGPDYGQPGPFPGAQRHPRPVQVNPPQVGPQKAGPLPVGSTQVSPLQSGPIQVSHTKAGLEITGLTQTETSLAGLAQASPSHARPSQQAPSETVRATSQDGSRGRSRRRRRNRKSKSAQGRDPQAKGKAPMVSGETAQGHVPTGNAFAALTKELMDGTELECVSGTNMGGQENPLVVSDESTLGVRRSRDSFEAGGTSRAAVELQQSQSKALCGINTAEVSIPLVTVSVSNTESTKNLTSRRAHGPTLAFEDLMAGDEVAEGYSDDAGVESDGSTVGLETVDTTGLDKDLGRYHISPARDAISDLGGAPIPSGRGRGGRSNGRGTAGGKSISLPTISR